MSIALLQSELFAGETWQVIYQAFQQINFNASDPSSINAAMRQYIQQTYPESFNDWIESSEFVAVLDLLAWLAGNLAFKTDISVRENFLQTAESRESVLRLARFLSYTATRNLPATGIVKIVSVSTSDNVLDSFGTNLANTAIVWNDPDNSNWLDQFTAILDDALIPTNPVGIPLSTGTVSNIATQGYQFNNVLSQSSVAFSATVSGTSMAFEICNGSFQDGGVLSELAPGISNALNFYYLNDGNGNGSVQTGYFLLFKQGTTMTQTNAISTPIANQVIDINSNGVNNSDVWVQTVDDSGNLQINWTQVPAVLSANITFNDISPSVRNIFAVTTRDNDQISVRFSDGNFGNAPVGNILTTYRVSNGLSYSIKPTDMTQVSLPITYYNPAGTQQTLTLTFSLQSTVSNAATTESTAQIAQRAPLVYATQNRMVSGQDYNSYPLSSNLAVKINAVNRIYSGQSRYIDLNDPTGTYRDLVVLGDDGTYFKEDADSYLEIPLTLNITPGEMVSTYMQPLLQAITTQNSVNDILMSAVQAGAITVPAGMSWTLSTAGGGTTTGSFNVAPSLLQTGCMLQMTTPTSSAPIWVGVSGITALPTLAPSANATGPVTLSYIVPTGSVVVAILPRFNSTFSTAVISQMTDTALGLLTLKQSFSIVYDYAAVDPVLGGTGSLLIAPATTSLGDPVLSGSQIVLMTVNYIPSLYRIQVRGLRHVFESASEVQWYDNGIRAADDQTGDLAQDTLRIMRVNQDLNSSTGRSLLAPYDVSLTSLYVYQDGTPEPRRTLCVFADHNEDGFPDNPDLWYRVSSNQAAQHYLFWVTDGSDPFVTAYTGMTVFVQETTRQNTTLADGACAFQINAALPINENTFWTYSATNGWSQDFSQTYSYGLGRGSNVAATWFDSAGQQSSPGLSLEPIVFKWNHVAPSDHRLDPCPSNIHDIFVLTYSYDASVRQWITAGATGTPPSAPSELDLRLAFQSLETQRMFSDGIVWRPVTYKMLFGNGADATLQGTFKVVRIVNSTISDGQVQSSVVAAINAYFSVQYWDFGQTFYFTSLAAYVHQQLPNMVASIVLVPTAANSAFGDGFEISCRSDEIFISTAQVSNVTLIASNTPSALRIS